MAQEQVATYIDGPISETQKTTEFQEHTKTYDAFIAWSKWTTMFTVALLIILYFVFVH